MKNMSEQEHLQPVAVKPLEWEELDGSYYSKDDDVKITTNGIGWGLSPKEFPHFGDYEHQSLEAAKVAAQADYEKRILSALAASGCDVDRKFSLGQRVTKTRGSKWTGKIVGFYSTELTPIGYAVESETEIGSVQIYPEAALEAA